MIVAMSLAQSQPPLCRAVFNRQFPANSVSLCPALPHVTRVIVLLLSLLIVGTPVEAAPTVKVSLQGGTNTNAVTFQRLEWIVELDQTYANPFDPEEIAVDAVFTGPAGKSLKIPAFWNQEFRPDTDAQGRRQVVAVGPARWLVRFAAPQSGDWRLQVFANDKTGQGSSTPLTFEVSAGKTPGFVRRASTNSRYLQFDSGAPYFMIGLNIGWGRLDEYESFFNKLSGAGGNFARVWISQPNPAIETQREGLGRYDLAGAWHYDQLLEMAEQKGIYLLLTVKNYRDLILKDYWGDAGWPVSPYNRTNGGPAARPADFFTDPLARKMYQRQLRYLIGRYSAFASLAFWEFWNEQDNMGVGSIAPWIKEMAAYVKANDPYRHLVTTSYGAMGEAEVWRLPEIDLTQRHFYGDEGSVHDASQAIVADTRKHDAFGKPHMMGELGISWRRSDVHFDPQHTGANLHNGLWASALSGNAGGASLWWWDDYVQPLDLWGHFTPLARFAAKVDWAHRDFQPVTVASPTFDKPANPDAFTDMVFTAAGDWGKADPAPLVVGADGLVSWMLPTFLYGPMKPDLRTTLVLKVELPKPCKLVVSAARASTPGKLQVSVDGQPTGQLLYQPDPNASDTEKAARRTNFAYASFTVAASDRNREVTIPKGAHQIELDVVEGDWIALESLRFTGARSPRVTGLQPLVLSDRASGETIAWVHDPAANWHSDSLQIQPALFEDVTISLPAPEAGNYKVDWWDTYKGEIIRTDKVRTEGDNLLLHPPPFRRDIALRATLAQAN